MPGPPPERVQAERAAEEKRIEKLKNAEVLRLLVVGQRLAQDVGDYPRLGKRIYRNAGMPADVVAHGDIAHPAVGAKK